MTDSCCSPSRKEHRHRCANTHHNTPPARWETPQPLKGPPPPGGAPGDWDCRQPFSLKLCLWGRRHQYAQRTWVLCSSAVLFNERTGSSFSACSIASTSSLRRLVNKNCGQQNVCPLVLSKVRRTESNPSRLTWTPWIAAAARKSQLTVYRQARSKNQPRKNNFCCSS